MNYFYHPNPEANNQLSNEESFHCVKVLRKKSGNEIDIVDGKGNIFLCRIEKDSHRSCTFSILEKRTIPKNRHYYVHMAIAPTKNQDRIEWFVEKACELAIDEITFIHTVRTERKRINLERIEKKAISAMKQSKNLTKTQINGLIPLGEFLKSKSDADQKFIAFVDPENERHLFKVAKPSASYLMLIGPEGDFSQEELVQTQEAGFQMVSLGKSVLRTETAGVVASHTLQLINE